MEQRGGQGKKVFAKQNCQQSRLLLSWKKKKEVFTSIKFLKLQSIAGQAKLFL